MFYCRLCNKEYAVYPPKQGDNQYGGFCEDCKVDSVYKAKDIILFLKDEAKAKHEAFCLNNNAGYPYECTKREPEYSLDSDGSFTVGSSFPPHRVYTRFGSSSCMICQNMLAELDKKLRKKYKV